MAHSGRLPSRISEHPHTYTSLQHPGALGDGRGFVDDGHASTPRGLRPRTNNAPRDAAPHTGHDGGTTRGLGETRRMMRQKETFDTPGTTYLYGGGHGFNGQVAIKNDARGTVQDVLISEQHTSSAARHKTPW